jgi:hypothetical protein
MEVQSMKIRTAQASEKDRWNRFVDREDGSFFHYFDWKYIYECRNQEYMPLIIEDDSEKIVGIMPAVKIKNFSFVSIYSIPEGGNKGILLRKDLRVEEKFQVMDAIKDYINERLSKSCSHIQFKEGPFTSDKENEKLFMDNGFKCTYDYKNKLPCDYILSLSLSFENDIWLGLWGKDLRNDIRMARKKGVIPIIDENLEYIDEFVEMYLYTMKRMGSLPISKEEITKRISVFKNKAKLFIGLVGSKPIISNLCYYTPSTCYADKIPSAECAYKFFSNRLITSFAIQHACENGYRYFDFGFSATSSLASWKNQFKAARFPVKFYEKDYPSIRSNLGHMLSFPRYVLYNNAYLWNNKDKLIKRHLLNHFR